MEISKDQQLDEGEQKVTREGKGGNAFQTEDQCMLGNGRDFGMTA